jgi:hypothetical protein
MLYLVGVDHSSISRQKWLCQVVRSVVYLVQWMGLTVMCCGMSEDGNSDTDW